MPPQMALRLRDAGLLAKPTHGNTLRFAPPLVISREQLLEATAIVREVVAACAQRQAAEAERRLQQEGGGGGGAVLAA